MSLTSDIFGVLTDAGAPTSLDEIMEALPDGADRHTVSTMLAQRKRAGEVVASVEDGKVHYAVAPGYDGTKRRGAGKPKPSPAQSSDAPPAKKPRALKERKRDFLAAAEQSQNVLKALQFNRDTARDALELYVTSRVDPSIYVGLQGALNSAQTALDAFVAGGRP